MSLRFVLLLVGAFIVAGIYLWERRKRVHGLDLRAPMDRSSSAEPSTLDLGGLTLDNRRKGPIWHATASGSLSAETTFAEPSGHGTAIFSVCLRSRNQRRLHGNDILRALERAGLSYGPMRIFHRYPPLAQHRRQPLFSVANALEPGTLEPASLPELRTAGLVFFLTVPGPEQPASALDAMLNCAERVSKELGCRLCDEEGDPLDEQRLLLLRKKLLAEAARVVGEGAL